MPKQSQSFCLLNAKQRKNTEKKLLKEKEKWRIKQKKNKKKRKEGFLTAFATAIKKDPTMSVRKHTNELKVLEKTVRTAIKQDLSPDP